MAQDSGGNRVDAQRTDRLGSGSLPSVTVAADGTFKINDLPHTK
ncbi:hypothetical protein [Streptomyces sp. NPDC056291]